MRKMFFLITILTKIDLTVDDFYVKYLEGTVRYSSMFTLYLHCHMCSRMWNEALALMKTFYMNNFMLHIEILVAKCFVIDYIKSSQYNHISEIDLTPGNDFKFKKQQEKPLASSLCE